MRRIIVSIAVLFLSISLLAQKQVIIRFISEDPTAINTAVDAFENADILFTMERTVQPDDTPEMKGALSKVQWKNNELVGKIVD